MKVLYFDTSAINRLADDPNPSLIVESLSQTTCSISIFTVVELVSTPNDKRRTHLISVAKELTKDYRPLAMPGQILSRSVSALDKGEETMDASMGRDSDGLWNAFCNPSLINEEALLEAQEWKATQERWYQDMHENGRPHVQAELATLSRQEREWVTKSASRLLKHFSRNREFVLTIIGDLAPPGVIVSRELVEGIADNLDQWRFFLAGMVYGMFCRSLQTEGYGWRSNPGSIDTQQAVYLAGCDCFITADEGREGGPWGGQHAMLRTILPFGIQRRTVWHYNRLREWCSTVARGA